MVRRQGPQLRSLIYDKADMADHVMRPRQLTPIKVRSATAPATGRTDSRIPRRYRWIHLAAGGVHRLSKMPREQAPLKKANARSWASNTISCISRG